MIRPGNNTINRRNMINTSPKQTAKLEKKVGIVEKTPPKVEKYNSVGDTILDLLGSNNITKSTAEKLFEEAGLETIKAENIKEAIKCGPNGENIKVTLENGKEFLFQPIGSSMQLTRYTDENGNTATFKEGLEAVLEQKGIIYGIGLHSPKEIRFITVDENGNIVVIGENGNSITFDGTTNEIISLMVDHNTYSMAEVQRALEQVKEAQIKELQEEAARYQNIFPDIAEQKREEIKELEELTTDQIEEISVDRDTGTLDLKMEGYGKLWPITFTNGQATSMWYINAGSSVQLNLE